MQGLRDLNRVLREMGDDKFWQRQLKAVNEAQARAVVAAAKRKAPKGETGRLERSITVNASTTRAGVAFGGARAPHGPVHEFGWAARNITAQPYVYPAIAETAVPREMAYSASIAELLSRAFPQ